MTWNPNTTPVDVVFLAGQATPGIAELQGWGSPRNFDERRGYGLSGATLRFRGVGLASGKLVLRLYTPEDWDAWDAFRPLVARPPAGERPSALDIVHPFTIELGVTSVVVTELKQPVIDDNGVTTIEIALKEYRRPQLALSPVEGSTDQPMDEVEQRIDRNDRRIRELNQRGARRDDGSL